LKEGIERGLREQGINHRSEIRPDAPPINLPYGDYGEHETAGMKRDRQRFTKLKQRLSKISGMPKDNKWVYDSIDDPYMSTEIAEHRELEYPVIKWNKGEEYAVLSNKSGKPLQDNKFSTKNPPKNIEYLQQFNNPEDALDYSEYKHTKEYGSHLFENDEHFKGLEKKFKHIKDPNTQYQ